LSIKAIPLSAANGIEGGSLTRMLAVFVAIFTGFVVKITFDISKDVRDRQKEVKQELTKIDTHFQRISMDILRSERYLYFYISGQEALSSENLDIEKVLGYSYARNIYYDPGKVNTSTDLSLNIFFEREELQEFLLAPRDREYIAYLANNFTHPSEERTKSIRQDLDKLVGLLEDRARSKG
jgi:hypothetical protein